MISDIPDFLDDKVFYADMIACAAQDGSRILADGPAGVLMSIENGTYLMASADEESAQALISLIDPAQCESIVVHEHYAVALIDDQLGFHRHTACLSSAFLGDHLPRSERTDLRIEPLGPQWADAVSDNYDMGGPSYVRSRIDAGQMWGAFRDTELAGFIGTHEEGSMGILYVFDRFRRQGIAEYLVTDLADRILTQGRVPYDHIIVGNTASEALQRKLGFSISTRQLWWMSRGDHGPVTGE